MISVATASAVIVSFALLLVLASSGAGDADSSGQQSMWVAVLSIVHVMFAMGVYGLVPMLFRRMRTSG